MASKKGLGKGLGSLFGDVADLNRGPVEVPVQNSEEKKLEQMVKIRLIEPNRNQPRKAFDEEALQELAESIRLHGIIQPLIVIKKDKHYEIIAGERRWRAAKIAGLKEVPVIIKEYTDEEIAEIALIENIQRKDLNPVEEAMAYKTLIEEYHLTQEALSERISKNRTVITNSMRILKLPEQVLQEVAVGNLSTGHAKVLLSLETPELQAEAAKQVLEKSLSVRETEKLVKTIVKPKEKKEKVLANQMEYEQVTSRLAEQLGTKVKITRKSDNAGKIEIDFYSLEDIERILKHIK